MLMTPARVLRSATCLSALLLLRAGFLVPIWAQTAMGVLSPGEPRSEVLEEGAVHRWTLSLVEGQYALVLVDQPEVDLVVNILDPFGKEVRTVDREPASLGPEIARLIGDPSGTWTLLVSAFWESEVGTYSIEWREVRPATESDRWMSTADSIETSALSHWDAGDLQEAEPLLRRVTELRERVLGPDDPQVGRALLTVGRINAELDRNEEAEPFFRRALSIYERALGPWDLHVSEALSHLSLLNWTEGRYRQAEEQLLRCLAIDEAALPPDHLEFAATLNNLAVLYSNQGRYSEAEPLQLRANAIEAAALGPDHPDLANGQNNLAVLYEAMGRFAESEFHYRRALAGHEASLGPDHPQVALVSNNLASVLLEQELHSEADSLLQRARRIVAESLGEEHRLYARVLTSLGGLRLRQERLDEAESLMREALTRREENLGPLDRATGESANSLGVLLTDLGRDEEAEAHLLRALEAFETVLGPDHSDLSIPLLNLARLYASRLEEDPEAFTQALATVERAIEILERGRVRQLALVRALRIRADLRRRSGDTTGATADLADALLLVEETRPQIGGGEGVRVGFFSRYLDAFDRMVEWKLQEGDLEEAFEYAERGRARVLLDQLASGKVDIRTSIEPNLRADLERREGQTRARLAEVQQAITLARGQSQLVDEARVARIAALQDSLGAADREYRDVYNAIKNASPLWRDLITSGGQPIELATLQRRGVPEAGLLLMYQIGQRASHLFIVPPSPRGEARAIPLLLSEEEAEVLGGDEGPFTSAHLRLLLGGEVTGLVSELGVLPTRSRISGRPGGTNLMDRLHLAWQVLLPEPVRAEVLAAEEVVIVPDEGLHHLPFETLVVDPGEDPDEARFWLDRAPPIRYAPSATSLFQIENRPDPPGARDVLTLSDPIYDPEELLLALAEPPREGEENPTRDFIGVTRNRYEREGGSFVRLPGTARETEAILGAFGGDPSAGDVVVLQQVGATEERLRRAIPRKRYVHLATHGLVDDRRGDLFSALVTTPPLGQTPDPDNDGFLQLHEIYGLEVGYTQLAVLSACESAGGSNPEGEGVFALSRGFLAAGARRVVASQWAVDDESTAMIMAHFFQEIADAEQAGRRIDYSRALLDAKLAVRRQERWADPYYWAPFVLTGKR